MAIKFTLQLLSCLSFVFACDQIYGAESIPSATSHKTSSTSQGYPLPKCVDDDAQLATIKTHMQTAVNAEKLAAKLDGKKSARATAKYDAIKTALKNEADDVLTARLIYSEAKAAHCPEFDPQIVAAIGAVIKNRIRARDGNAAKVIFEKDQFASSVNIYDIEADAKGPAAHSNWKEFMCPRDTATWDQALKIADSEKSEVPNDVFNYYLFQHSKRFSVPDWAKKPAVAFAGHEKLMSCVKLVKMPYP